MWRCALPCALAVPLSAQLYTTDAGVQSPSLTNGLRRRDRLLDLAALPAAVHAAGFRPARMWIEANGTVDAGSRSPAVR